MYVNEYGNEVLPKIILLHPMEVTGTELYGLIAPYLKGEYCVIAPDQGGHGKSGRYVSLEDEVAVLTEYLLQKGHTDIQLLYGASMGVTTAYELMKNTAIHIRKVWLDGGIFAADAPLANVLVKNFFLRTAKTFRKNPDRKPANLIRNYGEDMAQMMKQNFLKLGDEDLIRICDTFCHRDLKELPQYQAGSIHLDWGKSDMNYRLSRKSLKQYFPQTEVVLREGYGHCGYMAFHTREYVDEMENFMLH